MTADERELSVRAWTDADAARWDAYVRSEPEATFFHLSGWRRILEGTFGQRTHYLLAERGGAVAGVLPLARQQGLFGDALVSTPFCVYGGPVAADPAARRALEDAAVALAERLGVGWLEHRNLEPRRDDWLRSDRHVTFRGTIEADAGRNLLAIPRKQRAEVRKGIQRGLAAGPDTEPGAAGRCWAMFARSVHRHGTPVYARRYFADLAREFGDACEFYAVRDGGRMVAGLLNFYFRDQVLPYYAGTAPGGRDGEVHPFMYWSLMNHAAARGARLFDFGRSQAGSGAYAFKRNFGFEPRPLAYERRLVRDRAVHELDPKSPKFRLFVAAWRLLPAPLVDALGPWVAKQAG